MTLEYVLTAQLLDVLERISELDNDCDIGFLSPALADEVSDSIVALKAAMPDCRTCKWLPDCTALTPADPCTNGDQYQPAPKVVLWRTE